MPGTTRDLVTDTADIDGLRIDLVDTAGVRATNDEVEIEGVSRARQAWANADLVLLVVDRVVPDRRDRSRPAARNGRCAAARRGREMRSAARVGRMRRICPSSRCRRRPALGLDRLRVAMRTTLEAANPATAPRYRCCDERAARRVDRTGRGRRCAARSTRSRRQAVRSPRNSF